MVKPTANTDFAYTYMITPERLESLDINVAIGGCGQVVCCARDIGPFFVHRRTGTYYAWSPYEEHFLDSSGETVYVAEEPRSAPPALSRLASTSTSTLPDIPWPELFLPPHSHISP